jgi:iron complex outermembrane receptor protein
MRILFSAVSLCALGSAIGVSAAACAQDQASQPEAGDIVVTANRVESLASKTPVALTAFSEEGLRDAGITNPTALADNVPNLAINRNNGALQITIRGVTNTDSTEKGDPSAAFLLDGIYIARAQAQEVSFFDISRVEVLRGPQGTLYGRNTTAGLVNMITNRPNFDLGGSVDVGAGNFGSWQGSAVVNVPVSDNLAIRAAANFDQRDNYLIAGPRLTGDINPFKKNVSGRLQALYRWSSGDLLIRGDYSDIRGTPYDILPLRNFYGATTTGVDPVYTAREGKHLRYEDAPIGWDTYRRNSTWGVGAELNQDIGPVTLTYLGSYREFDRDESDARIDATGANAYRLAFVGHFKQNSQELRLATNGSGPLKLQAGGYYFKEESNIVQHLLLTPNTGQNGEGTSTVGFFQGPTSSESYAFFGQGTYSLTDTLRVTGGVRYSHDEKSRIGYTINCTTFSNCAPAADAVPNNNARGSFSKTTWKLGADFDLNSRSLLYGTVSTGYKAGGFNDGCEIGTGPGCSRAADTLYYAPETLTAYEAGLKTRMLDDALRLNLAVFHYDYSDIQLTQVINDCGNGAACSATSNGGSASVSGVEMDAVVTPSVYDKFDFSLAYLDAHYKDYRPDAATDYSGRPLDRSPRWTLNAGYQHSFPIGEGEVVAGVRTRMSDSYTLLILGTRNFYRQPSFTKTDATITYNAPGKRWYLQGFVRNIENTLNITTVVVGTRSSAQVADPRTYGVRAGFKF